MSLRRTLIHCRLKKHPIAIGVIILLVSIALLYHALMSHDNHGSGAYYLPREHRRGFRFHSKMDLGLEVNGNRVADGVKGLLHQPEFPKQGRDLLSKEAKEVLAGFLAQLYPAKWSSAAETDEMALELKHVLADFGLGGSLGCKDIDQMKVGSPITYSRTKAVDSISKDDSSRDYNHDSYDQRFRSDAIKVVSGERAMTLMTFNGDPETKIACMKEIYDPNFCDAMGNYRLLRQILLLSILRHSGVIALKGSCLRGNRVAQRAQDKGIMILTESGIPLSQSLTHGSSWSQQLGMALQISHLLLYLDKSPVGSLRFKKLDLKDFVLVTSRNVKLADLDDLELGEKRCSRSYDCQYNKIEFECRNGSCNGLNSYMNLNMAVVNVLSLVLSRPPQGNNEAAVDFVHRLSKMEFGSTEAVMAEIQILLREASKQKPLVIKDNVKMDNSARQPNQGVEPMQQADVEHNGQRDDGQGGGDVHFSASALSQFDRYNRTNFAGIFDYPCPGSRVSWGCFHTVASLREVATMCISDPHCKSFITFSTKPESENLMTVVMKNDSDLAISRHSSGTTLFVRRQSYLSKDNDPLKSFDEAAEVFNPSRKRPDNDNNNNNRVVPVVGRGPEHQDDVRRDEFHAGRDNNDEDIEDDGANADSKSLTEITQCLDDVVQSSTSARLSREKRLMTHLGLKGTKEKAWLQSASRQHLQGYTYLQKTNDGGGQFTINLTSSDPNQEGSPKEVAKRVTFIAEDGPGSYHMAYAVLYHLDRILGIYHTPPCAVREMSKETVEEYQASASWYEIFRQLITSEGTLTGILVPPTPKAIKVSKLMLQPLEAITSEVVPFERQEKLQLEYVILWWLGRIHKTTSDHLGYKGHLIHFHADKAFTDDKLNLSGYLNHCQFPNVVYRALKCFLCEDEKRGPSETSSDICSLGEEVSLRTTSMFPDELELYFHQLMEDDIIMSIDSAASEIFRIVSKCIRIFGRQSVLY